MNLWLCGQNFGDGLWDFQGIFDSKEKAIDACVDENYFITPAKLNDTYPHETVYFEDLYYPKNNER